LVRLPEPCRICEYRFRDLGGYRCQAFALTGDAAVTDPVCEFSPHHGELTALAEADSLSRDSETPCAGRVGEAQELGATEISKGLPNGSNLKVNTFAFLQVTDDLKEVARLRIALRAKHAHEAFW